MKTWKPRLGVTGKRRRDRDMPPQEVLQQERQARKWEAGVWRNGCKTGRCEVQGTDTDNENIHDDHSLRRREEFLLSPKKKFGCNESHRFRNHHLHDLQNNLLMHSSLGDGLRENRLDGFK